MNDIAPTWDLESVCPGGPGGETFIERQHRIGEELAALRDRATALGSLVDDGEAWRALVLELEAVRVRLHELSTFSGCAASADTRSSSARRAESLVDDVDQTFATVRVAIEAAVTAADDATYGAWIGHPSLADARPGLDHVREGRRFFLPRDQQMLFVEMERESLTAWGRMYDLVSGRLKAELDVDGETRTVGVAELLSRLSDADAGVRRAAHEAQLEAWGSVTDLCAHTLTQITGADRLELEHERSPGFA
ncbi:MAG: hypothetical protein AAF211_33095, partial [Myxococcota bacterium]